MLRSRVWSGSSIVSMLLATVPISFGIHQGNPAGAPPSLRSVNVVLFFNTRTAAS